MVLSMAKLGMSGLMEVHFKVSQKKTNLMGMVLVYGQMEINTSENSRTVSAQVKECSSLEKATNIKDLLTRVRDTDLEDTLSKTVQFMRENGKTVLRTEKVT